jgi:hypothetical protein
MATDFVSIPPDSTGKKIRHVNGYDVVLTSVLVDLTVYEVGDVVTGVDSGFTGTFTGTTTELGETFIHIQNANGEFTVGELLSIGGTNIGTVSTILNIYSPTVIMVDGDNPFRTQKIDKDGSSFVRYNEGDLGFDSFGHAQFSQATQLADWMFTYGDHADDFYDEILSGAAITASVADSSLLLSTPITSGSSITRTTHQYFPYNPGEGTEMVMSYRSGDTGTTNVVRRWGMFDDEDGLFFELSGSVFSVVIRNSSTGTVVDTKIPQSSFNGDGLDVVGFSEYVLDVSKYNIYWIDFQWLGAGKVRFGTLSPEGKRVTMHTVRHPNTLTQPYMRRGALPLRLQQFNLDTAGSGTESRMICVAVLRQNQIVTYSGHYYSITSPQVAVSSSVFTPIMSAKPLVTLNGEINRVTLIPTAFEVFVDGDPIEAQLVINGNLSGANYNISSSNDSAFIIDESATSYTGGTRNEGLIFGTGVTHRVLEETLENTLKLSADGVSQPVYTLAAKALKSGGNANVVILFRWKEAQ